MRNALMSERELRRGVGGGVVSDIAELAIGHKRTGLQRLYNFDQAWQLRCDAFANVSAMSPSSSNRASAEGKVVAMKLRQPWPSRWPTRTQPLWRPLLS